MTTTLTPEAAAFLDSVRAELADLPDAVLTDLMDDVEQHLAEVLAEGSLDDLGSPADYAAELRTAAGLPAHDAAEADAWALVRAVRRRHARVAQTRWYQEVRAFLPELRPAWWVARGYLFVVFLARLTHESVHHVLPIPYVSGNPLLGLVAVAAAVVASVKWGRRRRPPRGWRRSGVIAVNALAVVTALVVMDDIDDRTSYGVEYYYTTQPEGVYGPYGPITDIKPFDKDGNALTDVQLFDQDANPLANQICDRACKRLTFPLHRPPELPYDDGMHWPTPTTAPTPTTEPAPTTTPTPTAPPSPTPSPSP